MKKFTQKLYSKILLGSLMLLVNIKSIFVKNANAQSNSFNPYDIGMPVENVENDVALGAGPSFLDKFIATTINLSNIIANVTLLITFTLVIFLPKFFKKPEKKLFKNALTTCIVGISNVIIVLITETATIPSEIAILEPILLIIFFFFLTRTIKLLLKERKLKKKRNSTIKRHLKK